MYYIRGHVCLLSVINLDGVKIVFICKIRVVFRLSLEMRKCFFSLCVEVLVEERSVYKALVKLLALVNFAKHELPAESIVFVKRLKKFLLVEWLEQLRVVRVDAPVLSKAIEQGLGHVLEVTAHVEVVQSDTVIALKIKMVEHKVLWKQLQLYSLKTIVEKK